MTHSKRRRWTGLAVALALLLVGKNPSEANWIGEATFMAGSHDNFFFRGADSPAPSSNLLSAAVALEQVHENKQGEWTFGVAGSAVTVTDIDDAGYQTLDLSTEFKRGRWKAALSLQRLNNRLYSESGEPVFFDESAIEGWLRYSINRRLWVRFEAEFEDLEFEAAQDGRDSDADKFSLTLRAAVTETFAVRLGWLTEDRVARAPDNNRTGSGLAIAFEGAPRDDLTWFLRYRSRDRDYEDAPIDDRNFGRNDTVDDITFNVRWLFSERFGLMVRDSYRSGDSTRPDRNFTGNAIEAGIFIRFGTE